MASFLTPINNTSNVLDSYITQLNSNISQIFNDITPVMSTYFSKNVRQSTADGNLNSVVQIVGPEGAYRYNQIKNVPIYFENSLDPNIDSTDYGEEATNSEINFYVLPDTIVPQVDDFTYTYAGMGKNYLFRVTDVQASTLEGKSFYKVSTVLATEGIEQLNNQVVEKYELIKDELNQFAICEEVKLIDMRAINKFIGQIVNDYNQFFYKTASSKYMYKLNQEQYLIDNVINLMISEYLNGDYFKFVNPELSKTKYQILNQVHPLAYLLTDNDLTLINPNIILDIEFNPPASHSLDSYGFMTFYSEHFNLQSDLPVSINITQIEAYNLDGLDQNFFEVMLTHHVNKTLNLDTLINEFKALKPLALIDDKIRFFYSVPMFIYLVHQIFEAEYKSLFKYNYESTIK